jgi:hypothetical protein
MMVVELLCLPPKNFGKLLESRDDKTEALVNRSLLPLPLYI